MIIDIDNCIVDSRPLDKYEPSDRYSREGWDEYQKHYSEAIPNHFIIRIVRYLFIVHGITPIFVTAREDRTNCREKTEELLNSLYGSNNYFLFMRRDGDFSPDVEVKNEIYEKIIANLKPKEIVLAIDDKEEICKLWESKGIQTLCYKLPKIVT